MNGIRSSDRMEPAWCRRDLDHICLHRFGFGHFDLCADARDFDRDLTGQTAPSQTIFSNDL